METIKKLENLIGGWWHGISFLENSEKIADDLECRRVARFCEAIEMAIVKKMLIKPSQFTCPGACYAFGYDTNLKETITEKLVETKGYSPQHAARLLDNTPRLKEMPEYIAFNCMDSPDIVISQLQPDQAMHLLQRYQTRQGKTLHTEISGIISACGNVAVRAMQEQDMTMSFGCEDSRTFSGLSRDRLYVGLPYALAEELVS